LRRFRKLGCPVDGISNPGWLAAVLPGQAMAGEQFQHARIRPLDIEGDHVIVARNISHLLRTQPVEKLAGLTVCADG
jgi:hypothetical protein